MVKLGFLFPGSDCTIQAIRNITFTNSREFVGTFSKFIKNYGFRVQSSLANSRTEFAYERENKRKNSYANFRNSCTNFEGRK